MPLQAVSKMWRPAPFSARASKLNGAAATLQGILLRTPAGLRAFCLHCPHELCFLNLTEDERSGHPLLVCPCHFSTFDPVANGARLSGPAERGAYLFRLEVSGNRVHIREVEEQAL